MGTPRNTGGVLGGGKVEDEYVLGEAKVLTS